MNKQNNCYLPNGPWHDLNKEWQQGCKHISRLSLALSKVFWTTTLVTSDGKVNSLLRGTFPSAILGNVGKTLLIKRKFVFLPFSNTAREDRGEENFFVAITEMSFKCLRIFQHYLFMVVVQDLKNKLIWELRTWFESPGGGIPPKVG